MLQERQKLAPAASGGETSPANTLDPGGLCHMAPPDPLLDGERGEEGRLRANACRGREEKSRRGRKRTEEDGEAGDPPPPPPARPRGAPGLFPSVSAVVCFHLVRPRSRYAGTAIGWLKMPP